MHTAHALPVLPPILTLTLTRTRTLTLTLPLPLTRATSSSLCSSPSGGSTAGAWPSAPRTRCATRPA
eukprot:scaffold7461_cov42-Phaeocystis_antarctica.AAC.1